MKVSGALLSVVASLYSFASAAPQKNNLVSRQDPSTDGRPTNYTAYTIDQLIDHFPNSSRYAPHTTATFSQRYYFDNTYYKAGGPVFLYIGGETDGPSRFSNLQTGIIQILMQATNGLGVILENRYYGESYPFNSSTTDELRFLTTEQTIADNAYFAEHATFPGVEGNLSAHNTPWILYGGSLAGGETAYSLVTYQGLLWGGIAASAPIHFSLGYPEWYNPIQALGPQNCITYINNIIAKMDYLIAENNTEAIQKLKDIFGLGPLSDLRDFAMTIAFPIGGPMNYPTNTWQELNWRPAYDPQDFWEFCGNITDQNAPKNITDVDYVLANYTNGEPWTGLGGYAEYIKNVIVPLCPSTDLIDTTTPGCFSTQNETFYADPTNSAARSYLYTSCTELGAYQVAQPGDIPTLLSRVVQIDYTQQWCTWAFPAGQSNSVSPNGPNPYWTDRYGGWNISAPRLAFIDGSADVWLDLCYHSHNATKNGPRYGVNQYLINGGGHHWDSWGILNVSAEPDFIREAHLWEIWIVKEWLKEWDEKCKMKRDEL